MSKPRTKADLARALTREERRVRHARRIIKAQRAALWQIAQALGMAIPLPNTPHVVDVVVRYAQETREALDALRRGTP